MSKQYDSIEKCAEALDTVISSEFLSRSDHKALFFHLVCNDDQTLDTFIKVLTESRSVEFRLFEAFKFFLSRNVGPDASIGSFFACTHESFSRKSQAQRAAVYAKIIATLTSLCVHQIKAVNGEGPSCNINADQCMSFWFPSVIAAETTLAKSISSTLVARYRSVMFDALLVPQKTNLTEPVIVQKLESLLRYVEVLLCETDVGLGLLGDVILKYGENNEYSAEFFFSIIFPHITEDINDNSTLFAIRYQKILTPDFVKDARFKNYINRSDFEYILVLAASELSPPPIKLRESWQVAALELLESPAFNDLFKKNMKAFQWAFYFFDNHYKFFIATRNILSISDVINTSLSYGSPLPSKNVLNLIFDSLLAGGHLSFLLKKPYRPITQPVLVEKVKRTLQTLKEPIDTLPLCLVYFSGLKPCYHRESYNAVYFLKCMMDVKHTEILDLLLSVILDVVNQQQPNERYQQIAQLFHIVGQRLSCIDLTKRLRIFFLHHLISKFDAPVLAQVFNSMKKNGHLNADFFHLLFEYKSQRDYRGTYKKVLKAMEHLPNGKELAKELGLLVEPKVIRRIGIGDLASYHH